VAASLIALPDVWKSQINTGNYRNLPRQDFWIEKEEMLGKPCCIVMYIYTASHCLMEGGDPST